MLAAYRSGIFPMPVDGELGWFSPDPRAIRPVGEPFRRSVRRARARYVVRVDAAFDDVVAGCADPSRPGGWITAEMRRAYRVLRDLGWAHSVEAWTPDGRLAGGLFGIAIGGFFAAESMFHSLTDGSKAAVAGLVEILAAAPQADSRLLDVQWTSAHLATLGVVEVSRADYLARLEAALVLPDPFEVAG
jgi:leucyl/phenylalanyl-tRNA--protein transferase